MTALAEPRSPAERPTPIRRDSAEPQHQPARVLLVDDEAAIVRAFERILGRAGHVVTTCTDPEEAVARVADSELDLVISDISMPAMTGIDLLRLIREHDADLPVVLVTGSPSLETATEAVELGALKYMQKPVTSEDLVATVEYAARIHRLAQAKRAAVAHLGSAAKPAGDRATLEASFARALDRLWMAFQPIIESDGSVFGYEALVRSDEPDLPHPGALIDAAERLGRLVELSRAIRARVAQAAVDAPPGALLFVNLHPQDLLDDDLYSDSAPLAALAGRVVYEITERVALAEIPGLQARLVALRQRGYRLAVDDLGAGYAGLSTFTLVHPDVVKIDMSLVRDIDRDPIKRKLVGSMLGLCRDMEIDVVAEGVETPAERDALLEIGAPLLQGFLFAKPGRGFAVPRGASGAPAEEEDHAGVARTSATMA